MNTKTKIKVLVDIAMSMVLFICMSYQFIGQENHEIAGAVMLILFILHHILNVRWFMGLTKGKYGLQRIFLTIIDFSVLLTMLLLMISGIRMSRMVFAFINIEFIGMGTARIIHMVTSYLGFLLMGIHIGLQTLNWSAMQSGIVNRVNVYIAPKMFGGMDAFSLLGGMGIENPAQAFTLKNTHML